MTLPSLNAKQSDVLSALRGFLQFALPGIEIVQGFNNRVSGPAGPNYVVMLPLLVKRLATNIDLYADCAFLGTISVAGVLSVTQMLHGTITVGNTLFGTNVPNNVSISGTISASGSVGTYQLSGTFGALSSAKFACGVIFATQKAEFTVQVDVYGPSAADNAQIISTLFRDDVAIEQFSQFSPSAPPGWSEIPPGGTVSDAYDGVRPLYADDPRQMNQIFGEMQYEIRWSIDACMQANQIVTAPQQFLDTAHVTQIDVPLQYP